MARVTGLEPAASGVTGRRSNQLSYTRILAGVSSRAPPNPRQPAAKPNLVGGDGFEPPTLSV